MKKITLFSYIKKYIPLIILSLILSVGIVVLQLFIPYYIGKITDLIVSKGNVNFELISKYLIIVAIETAVFALAQYLMIIINNLIAFNISEDIRNDSIDKICNLPLRYIDSRPYGDIIANVIVNVEQLSDGLLLGFSQFFVGVITILGTISIIFYISWKIGLVVLLVTPLSLFAAKFIASRSHSMFVKQTKIRDKQTSFVEEMIHNQKIVRAFSHEEQNQKDFDKINDNLYNCALKANFYASITNPTTRFINYIVYALVCLVGSLNVILGNLTVGRMTTLLFYSNQYTKPFNDISSVIAELQNALTCSSRILEFLNEQENPNEDNKLVLNNPKGNFKIDHVEFSYNPYRPLITDFNLEVKQGQVVALVGPTGCGKTTFINLLMRFYDPISGTISIDGVNTSTYSKKSFRRCIGMVLQETWLKTGTIRENITLGKEDATEEEIIQACKDAHSYHFIMQLKDGLDTFINEDGGNLSQGQKQLLCITRIMLCKPEILILDEATSSIDTRTELKIQNAFDKLMKGRTSFIVAHRLSTIQNADIILVMKDGNIIEKGTHEELLTKNGFYSTLYNSQFKHN